jgi:hypothetical protein
MRKKLITFLTVLYCMPALNLRASEGVVDSLLASGRQLYYASVTDMGKIDPAITLFMTISRCEEKYQGRALTYIGSLTALRAKFALWPHEKWKAANEGLRLMDKGLAGNPDDIEALFIHGTTCYFLPPFFGRADDAQRQFRKIVRLLPANAHKYDASLVANVIHFITARVQLSDEERTSLADITLKLAQW